MRPVTLELFPKSGPAVSAGASDSGEYFSRLLRSARAWGSESGGDTVSFRRDRSRRVALACVPCARQPHFGPSAVGTVQADQRRRSASPISVADQRRQLFHKDPFDRMLIAQALMGGMAIVTADRSFEPYPVRIIW